MVNNKIVSRFRRKKRCFIQKVENAGGFKRNLTKIVRNFNCKTSKQVLNKFQDCGITSNFGTFGVSVVFLHSASVHFC